MASHEAQADEHLLHSDSIDERRARKVYMEDDVLLRPSLKPSWLRSHWKATLFHTLMTLLYLILVLLTFQDYFTVDTRPLRMVFSPAQPALEYHVLDDMYNRKAHPNKFMGMTNESDQAWSDLMKGTNIRLTEGDMKHLDRPSVSLGDGGYLGMLGVFHELHCLKMIRWSLNLDRYGHNYSPKDIKELPDHIDHCLDMVRQSLMCRGDVSPIAFYWTDHSRVPETDFHSKHQCINWDKLDVWLKSHSVDVYKKGMLNHPDFGATYPGGHRLIEDDMTPAMLPVASISD